SRMTPDEATVQRLDGTTVERARQAVARLKSHFPCAVGCSISLEVKKDVLLVQTAEFKLAHIVEPDPNDLRFGLLSKDLDFEFNERPRGRTIAIESDRANFGVVKRNVRKTVQREQGRRRFMRLRAPWLLAARVLLLCQGGARF